MFVSFSQDINSGSVCVNAALTRFRSSWNATVIIYSCWGLESDVWVRQASADWLVREVQDAAEESSLFFVKLMTQGLSRSKVRAF